MRNRKIDNHKRPQSEQPHIEADLRMNGPIDQEFLRQRAIAAAGSFSGPVDFAQNHDAYFVEAILFLCSGASP